MAAILGALRLGLQHPKPGALALSGFRGVPGAGGDLVPVVGVVLSRHLARLQLRSVRAWPFPPPSTPLPPRGASGPPGG